MRQHTINIKEKHFAVLHDSLIVVGKSEIRKTHIFAVFSEVMALA